MNVRLQKMVSVRPRRERGFTLMEMVLVLAIISVLVAIGAATMTNVFGDANTTAVTTGISSLETSLIRYRTKAGMFPTAEQGLQALVTRPTSNPIPKKWKQLLKKSCSITLLRQ